VGVCTIVALASMAAEGAVGVWSGTSRFGPPGPYGDRLRRPYFDIE
jgi:hypothetical protein